MPSSSYSILAFEVSPKLNLVSSFIITSPSPFGTNLMWPSALFEYIVFPSIVRLSTVQVSTLGRTWDAYAGPNPEAPPPGWPV